MSGRHCKVLIFDWDEDTLLSLQHVLEDAGFHTTVTWDEAEARNLIKNKGFDLILVGDHPPELTSEAILRDFNINLVSCPCLLLRGEPSDSEHFRRLGFSGVVPKRDPFRVLEQVQKHWRSKASDADSKPVGLAKGQLAAGGLLKPLRQVA